MFQHCLCGELTHPHEELTDEQLMHMSRSPHIVAHVLSAENSQSVTHHPADCLMSNALSPVLSSIA
jgi:hypothetical protein